MPTYREIETRSFQTQSVKAKFCQPREVCVLQGQIPLLQFKSSEENRKCSQCSLSALMPLSRTDPTRTRLLVWSTGADPVLIRYRMMLCPEGDELLDNFLNEQVLVPWMGSMHVNTFIQGKCSHLRPNDHGKQGYSLHQHLFKYMSGVSGQRIT